jgi:hypothetical protein
MAIRSFRDAEGRTWRVWHVVPQSEVLRATSPELTDGWLCFEYDGQKRRLVSPPTAWLDSTDDELLALLGAATPVKRPGID